MIEFLVNSRLRLKTIIHGDKRMKEIKIVLTNDDGIDAPGLDALHSILQPLGTVIVVAPDQPQSWVSHRVTALSPIRVTEIARDRFSVGGTPADCSRIALKKIAPEAAWVFSGINPGANLGSDVYNSGTVAAAREAAILGCPAIAVSQYIAQSQHVDWGITARHARSTILHLWGLNLEPGHFWNLNLPHPLSADRAPDHQFCGLDPNPHDYEYRRQGDEFTYQGIIHNRPRDPGKDVDVCFGGKISITRIAIGTTAYPVGV